LSQIEKGRAWKKECNIHKILVEKPRGRGTIGENLENNIKMDSGLNFLAQY